LLVEAGLIPQDQEPVGVTCLPPWKYGIGTTVQLTLDLLNAPMSQGPPMKKAT